MPNALFYQPSCGISGDMHLAAMLDLGVPEDWLREQLAKLPVTSEFELTVSPGSKMGISGTTARVSTADTHDHRHHSTIVKLIQSAGYPPAVEARALAIFAAIAQAEGKIHDIPPEKVHFHEVGAVDSIVDIVAAALCIEYLQVEHILCAPIEVGGGFVDCAHGRFPVPAPATQELLQQAPCTYGGVDGESTTPTGAAILAQAVTEFSPGGAFAPTTVGYGVGHKDFSRPNVLRVVLGEYGHASQTQLVTETQFKIEANIDDMSPETYEPLMQALFAAGAVDVYLTPVVMKKSRPAHILTALADAEHQQAVCDSLFNHSTTIGLRVIAFEKQMLPRELRQVTTRYGDVQVKYATQPDGHTRWKSEHEAVARIAAEQQLDYQRVKADIDHDIRQALDS